MAVGAVETQNLILDAWLGPNRAAAVPASYDIEAWCGDPRDDDSVRASVDDVDLDAIEWNSDDWSDAADGEKQTAAPVEWTLTDAADDEITHWALRNRTSGALAYSDVLTEKVFPLDAGTLSITPTVTWADSD